MKKDEEDWSTGNVTDWDDIETESYSFETTQKESQELEEENHGTKDIKLEKNEQIEPQKIFDPFLDNKPLRKIYSPPPLYTDIYFSDSKEFWKEIKAESKKWISPTDVYLFLLKFSNKFDILSQNLMGRRIKIIKEIQKILKSLAPPLTSSCLTNLHPEISQIVVQHWQSIREQFLQQINKIPRSKSNDVAAALSTLLYHFVIMPNIELNPKLDNITKGLHPVQQHILEIKTIIQQKFPLQIINKSPILLTWHPLLRAILRYDIFTPDEGKALRFLPEEERKIELQTLYYQLIFTNQQTPLRDILNGIERIAGIEIFKNIDQKTYENPDLTGISRQALVADSMYKNKDKLSHDLSQNSQMFLHDKKISILDYVLNADIINLVRLHTHNPALFTYTEKNKTLIDFLVADAKFIPERMLDFSMTLSLLVKFGVSIHTTFLSSNLNKFDQQPLTRQFIRSNITLLLTAGQICANPTRLTWDWDLCISEALSILKECTNVIEQLHADPSADISQILKKVAIILFKAPAPQTYSGSFFPPLSNSDTKWEQVKNSLLTLLENPIFIPDFIAKIKIVQDNYESDEMIDAISIKLDFYLRSLTKLGRITQLTKEAAPSFSKTTGNLAANLIAEYTMDEPTFSSSPGLR